ncbi:MAG: hypothetical protein IJZ77_01500 [Bacilli bacterium]|nr:hypothetical protein [Bacilli bacterium]
MNRFINNDYDSLADYLFSFTGNEFSIISSIIAFVISQNLTIDQANSLGNFFELVGQFMITKAAQDQVIQSKQNNRNN